MGRHGAGRPGEERPLPAASHLPGGNRRASAGPPAPARDRAGAAGHASVALAARCDVGRAFGAGGALARGGPGGRARRGRAAVDRRPRRRRYQGAIRGRGRHRWGRARELLRAAVRTSPRRRRWGERRVACTLTLVASSLAAQQRPRGTVFADGAIVRFGEVSGTPAGSFSGPTFGVEGGVSLGSLRLGAGYLEGRVQPSTGSSDSVAKDP